MRVAVVGAGPVGCVLSVALARRGHEVVVVDRDPGPVDGRWERLGVMQFLAPHGWRPQVRLVLDDLAPDLWTAIVAAGGVPNPIPGMPPHVTGLACRRLTVERALRECLVREPGVTVVTGHAEKPMLRDGRVVGLTVDDAEIAADLVVSCAGRASHFGEDLREPGHVTPTGISYVNRMYRALPGTPDPESLFPSIATHAGYQTVVFPQDDRTISVLFVRPAADAGLAGLRETGAYEAAARAVPHLAPWTDPDGWEPVTPTIPGSGGTNSYVGQGGAPDGIVFVGDAVSTTNPAAGRGVTLGLLQVKALPRRLDDGDGDVGARFDEWCRREVEPWVDDHRWWDEVLARRWAGQDLDVEGRLPSDVVVAAATEDPSMMPVVGPYLAMTAGPGSLAAVEDRARALLRTGWRPPWAPGPTRDELAAVVAAAL